MIVVDTSALIAILDEERDAVRLFSFICVHSRLIS
jgi:uncharacterized protein with PIN domain